MEVEEPEAPWEAPPNGAAAGNPQETPEIPASDGQGGGSEEPVLVFAVSLHFT